MPRQYSHDFVFERDFPENVKTIFFNGKTYSKEKFNSEKAKYLKRNHPNNSKLSIKDFFEILIIIGLILIIFLFLKK